MSEFQPKCEVCESTQDLRTCFMATGVPHDAPLDRQRFLCCGCLWIWYDYGATSHEEIRRIRNSPDGAKLANPWHEGQEMRSEPLYSVGTWDTDKQAFTPQHGLSVPSFNITRSQLRQAVRELRRMKYQVKRVRDADGKHWESDPSVFIERTDGKNWKEIMKGWRK